VISKETVGLFLGVDKNHPHASVRYFFEITKYSLNISLIEVRASPIECFFTEEQRWGTIVHKITG
jgi:hypothetical protein